MHHLCAHRVMKHMESLQSTQKVRATLGYVRLDQLLLARVLLDNHREKYS